MSFKALNLSDSVLRGIQAAGYTDPTPIQLRAIPVLLGGGDLIASAQTGTGKTAAFALPILTRLGQHGRARVLVLEPEGDAGETARANIERLELRLDEAPATLPQAYVARLFDQYAGRFDTALTEGLRYRAPLLLREAIVSAAPGRRFARAFDLGCGTGLGGAAVRDLVGWLGGVDLSPAMLRQAEHKNIYDHLETGDMVTALAHLTARCDLVISADALVYLGELGPVFGAVRGALAPDGLFAFTAQGFDSLVARAVGRHDLEDQVHAVWQKRRPLVRRFKGSQGREGREGAAGRAAHEPAAPGRRENHVACQIHGAAVARRCVGQHRDATGSDVDDIQVRVREISDARTVRTPEGRGRALGAAKRLR